uniref:L antigen family member 3 n=1 Tax=Capra hircus TaxID=9925 RepID=A0A8C2SBU0_CAPHI
MNGTDLAWPWCLIPFQKLKSVGWSREHGSRGVRRRGSLGVSTFGGKQSCAHNHLRGPSRDCKAGVRWSLNLATTSSNVVLFLSPMEAEMARQSLSPHVQPYHRAVGKELTVNGSIIAIRLTAEDPGLLQSSIVFCLEQLSLVMRSLQHFGAPVSQHKRGV